MNLNKFHKEHPNYLIKEGRKEELVNDLAEGIGTIGMFINFIIAIIVSRFTKPTPERIKQLVENIRYPK